MFALSDNLIFEDWFFAEGERFLFLCPQYISTELDLALLEGDGLVFLVVAVFAHEGLE